MADVSTFQASTQTDLEGRPVLGVEGDLDLASAQALIEAAEKIAATAPEGPLRLDLAGVTFMDSTGLGALIKVRNAALDRGSELEIVGRSKAAERAFTLAGLDDVFGEASD